MRVGDRHCAFCGKSQTEAPSKGGIGAFAITILKSLGGAPGVGYAHVSCMAKARKVAMRKSVKCRNPKIGEHPDLFERDEEGRPAMTAVWSGGPAPTDPHAQYAKDMSKERLRSLPRNAFDEAAWDALDADDQEYIREHDPESLARIKELVDAFVDREKYLIEPDESTKQYWIEQDAEYFIQWLHEQDEIVDSVQDEVYELVRKIQPDPDDNQQDMIRGAINEAMRDADNYDFSLSGNEYSREGIYKQRILSAGGIYIESRDLQSMVDALYPDELEEAIKQIKHDTYIHVDTKMLTRGYDLEIEYEVGFYFVADPNWDKIEAKARELLGQEGEPEALTPWEERVVYRFKDGFYVVDLLSSELPAEGKAQGICVGQGRYGYAGAVKRGETKIFSLRRPSGKPLFTIEAEMGGEDSSNLGVISIIQIKGKANRLPGWDAGKDGSGDMKIDEVQKAVEFVRSLNISPDTVRDLRPAILWASQNRLSWNEPAQLGPKKNPGRLPKLPSNDRPLGFDSPWTP